MAISPILLNASIQQTDNVLHSQLRHAEKGMVDQGNIQLQEQKKEYQKAKQVVRHDDTVFKQGRFDAKEKGSNSYSGDGGRRRNNAKDGGRAVSKHDGVFDMKV